MSQDGQLEEGAQVQNESVEEQDVGEGGMDRGNHEIQDAITQMANTVANALTRF